MPAGSIISNITITSIITTNVYNYNLYLGGLSASDIIGNNFLYFELDDYNNITVFNNGLLETLFTEDTDILIIFHSDTDYNPPPIKYIQFMIEYVCII